jgi:hypothetical protein
VLFTAAPGAAGKGVAQTPAIKIAKLVFPNCLTVPAFLSQADRHPINPPHAAPHKNLPGSEVLPHAVRRVNKHSQKPFVAATGRLLSLDAAYTYCILSANWPRHSFDAT